MSQTRNEEGPPDYHRPVLVDEVIDLIRPVMPGVVIDATFGGGGHSKRMIEEFGEDVKVIGIDRDPEAVAQGAAMGISVVEANFSDIGEVAERLTEAPVAVLFDFGVSSRQLDSAARGFSYHHEGPLDMRMGPDAATSAAEIVNEWSMEELTRIIRRFGEEPLARRIAVAIVAARPLDTTADLAKVIADAMPAARRSGGHPARRVFQAFRIAVNSELEAVASGLEGAIGAVDVGGRVLAISYHSLEDRIVKRRFVAGAAGCTCPPGLPVCGCGNTASLRILTRKPIRASDQEVATNKRARSALLRAAEKVAA
jgi:16S rRNA (cytosine1402-N4)-methyltransferase